MTEEKNEIRKTLSKPQAQAITTLFREKMRMVQEMDAAIGEQAKMLAQVLRVTGGNPTFDQDPQTGDVYLVVAMPPKEKK